MKWYILYYIDETKLIIMVVNLDDCFTRLNKIFIPIYSITNINITCNMCNLIYDNKKLINRFI